VALLEDKVIAVTGAAAIDKFGRIDGAVCVAGMLRERMLFNTSKEEWDGVIDTHLKDAAAEAK
jgi:NAD(P)-dependent dehydrogenase (short-subunit alcohol dehydrogenase family)